MKTGVRATPNAEVDVALGVTSSNETGHRATATATGKWPTSIDERQTSAIGDMS